MYQLVVVLSIIDPARFVLENQLADWAVSFRLDRRTLVIPLGYTGPRSLERPGSTESVEGVTSPVI